MGLQAVIQRRIDGNSTANSGTTWQTVTDGTDNVRIEAWELGATGGQYSVGDEVLILASCQIKTASVVAHGGVRIAEIDDANSEIGPLDGTLCVREIATATGSGEYLIVQPYTIKANTGLEMQVARQAPGGSSNITLFNATLIAIYNGTTDVNAIFADQNATDTVLGTSASTSNNPSVTFTATSGDEYLVLGYQLVDADNTSDTFSGRVSYTTQTGKDHDYCTTTADDSANENYCMPFAEVLVANASGSTTVELQARSAAATTHTRTHGGLAVISLNDSVRKFEEQDSETATTNATTKFTGGGETATYSPLIHLNSIQEQALCVAAVEMTASASGQTANFGITTTTSAPTQDSDFVRGGSQYSADQNIFSTNSASDVLTAVDLLVVPITESISDDRRSLWCSVSDSGATIGRRMICQAGLEGMTRPEPRRFWKTTTTLTEDTTGTPQYSIDGNVARSSSVQTTSTTPADITGISFSITLDNAGEIMALLSVGGNLSVAGTGYWLIDINGTDSPVVTREFASSTDDGVASVVFRSGNLSAGTYTVKGEHYCSTGTLTSSDISLVAWPLEDSDGNAIPSVYDTVASDTTTSTSFEDIDGLTANLSPEAGTKVFAALAISSETTFGGVGNDYDARLDVAGETFFCRRTLRDSNDVGATGVCGITANEGPATTTIHAEHLIGAGTLTASPATIVGMGLGVDDTTPGQLLIIPSGSASVGGLNTTSSTLVDIPEATFSLKIDTATRIVFGVSASIENSGSANDASISIQVVGQQTKTVTRTISNSQDVGNVVIYECTDSLTAGTYTVKCQWSTTGGTLSMAAQSLTMFAFGMETAKITKATSSFTAQNLTDFGDDIVRITRQHIHEQSEGCFVLEDQLYRSDRTVSGVVFETFYPRIRVSLMDSTPDWSATQGNLADNIATYATRVAEAAVAYNANAVTDNHWHDANDDNQGVI